MLISEKVARQKWCPYVRVDSSNRLHNSLTDGFQDSEKMYHCIAGGMGWRQLHLTYMKGGESGVTSHGYCGYAGRPEHD
jgi:hypothetical protein